MDVKLILVLTFTTIVVATALPSSLADPKADGQYRSRGDCNYVTLQGHSRFCVYLEVPNWGGHCIDGLSQNLPQCPGPKGYCPLFYIRDGWTTDGSFQICRSRDGSYCYYSPNPRVCNPWDVKQLAHMEQDANCICVEDKEGNKVCSPKGCDSFVHMENDIGCICVEDSKGNKVCTPPGCDAAQKQSDDEADCVCVKGSDGNVVCSPPNCDSNDSNQFIAELSKLEKKH